MTLNLDKEYVLDIRMKAERAAYGEGIIKDLSYLTFKEDEFPYALRRELSRTHYRLIMRIENPKGREFYITECAEQNRNTRTLERHINTFYFERLLSSRDKKPKRSSIEGQAGLDDFIKDPYVFEFLNIPEPVNATEHEIESGIIQNLQQLFATKYMPYLPTEAELIAEIEREKRKFIKRERKKRKKKNA